MAVHPIAVIHFHLAHTALTKRQNVLWSHVRKHVDLLLFGNISLTEQSLNISLKILLVVLTLIMFEPLHFVLLFSYCESLSSYW